MIIAIDAASTDLSIALATDDGDRISAEAWHSLQRQSAELLPRLMALLDGARLELRDASLIAVGVGPGSFTGLRVAMALAKGLAVGLERPILGIGSLVAWLDARPTAHAAVSRAGAREGHVLDRGATEPTLADQATIRERLGTVEVVAPADVAAALGLSAAVGPGEAAVAIARLAAERRAEGHGGDDLTRLEPQYVHAPRGIEGQAGAPWR